MRLREDSDRIRPCLLPVQFDLYVKSMDSQQIAKPIHIDLTHLHQTDVTGVVRIAFLHHFQQLQERFNLPRVVLMTQQADGEDIIRRRCSPALGERRIIPVGNGLARAEIFDNRRIHRSNHSGAGFDLVE